MHIVIKEKKKYQQRKHIFWNEKEEKSEGRPHCSLHLPLSLQREESQSLFLGDKTGHRAMVSNCTRGGLDLTLERTGTVYA